MKSLKGTERQIKFANDIRDYVLFQIKHSQVDELKKDIFTKALERQGSAKFIIDTFSSNFKLKNVRAVALDFFTYEDFEKITQAELKKFGCTSVTIDINLKDLNFFEEGYEEKSKLIANTSKKIENYLGYIENNINSYWYKNGEKVVLEGIEILSKNNIDTNKYSEALNNLRNKFEEINSKIKREKKVEEKNKEKIKNKNDVVKEEVNFDKTFRSSFDDFEIGMVIVEENKAYKIIKERKQYIAMDGWSFGLQSDRGYLYLANAIDITETEEGKLKLKEYEEEENRKIETNKIIKSYKDLLNIIREESEYLKKEDINLDDTEELINNMDIYGGTKILIKDNILFIVNYNGSDGDNWELNNYGSYIVTKYKATKEEIDLIKKYKEINK